MRQMWTIEVVCNNVIVVTNTGNSEGRTLKAYYHNSL